jgi:hypothetical protein
MRALVKYNPSSSIAHRQVLLIVKYCASSNIAHRECCLSSRLPIVSIYIYISHHPVLPIAKFRPSSSTAHRQVPHIPSLSHPQAIASMIRCTLITYTSHRLAGRRPQSVPLLVLRLAGPCSTRATKPDVYFASSLARSFITRKRHL